MKYDDASWHYDGNFPDELLPEAGATHSGMFFAWALLAGLGGDLHTDEFPEELEQLQTRSITPGQAIIKYCDEKLTDEDLNEEGNCFAEEYFNFDKGKYLSDYESLLARELPTTYHVADTWENFERLKPLLDQRFQEWRERQG